MISAEEALSLVFQQQRAYGIEEVDLMQAPGRLLAQDILADRDYPAFNRVAMDGIAIALAAWEAGHRRFHIAAIQAAGEPACVLSNPLECIEVMTGAVLPANTNAVIPYELLAINDGAATVPDTLVSSFQHVHRQGADSTKDTVLLQAGIRLSAAHIGILAATGTHRVPVKRLPTVAICSTGNELVEVNEQPLPHQIRKSNVYMLAAALQQEGIQSATFHVRDDREEMAALLAQVVANHDLVLFSGAVSKGKYDYLPEVLTTLGMHTLFHRIAQKPGKPLLLGTFDNNTLVFGFPGNPASTFVCYHLYCKPWLYQCLGYRPKTVSARLDNTIVFKPHLAYHIPVSLSVNDGLFIATPVTGTNSGDLPALAAAEGIISLPADRETFEKGELFNVTYCV